MPNVVRGETEKVGGGGRGRFQRYEHDANSICDSIVMEYITAGLFYPAKRNTVRARVIQPCMASLGCCTRVISGCKIDL